MEPIQRESIPGAICGARIDLLVAADKGVVAIDFTNPLAKVSNQLFEGQVLSLGRQVPIEVADQADPDRYVIQVVAVHMAAGKLVYPAVTDFDLSIAGGSAVADYEMVGEAVRHFAYVPVVIVKNSSIALTRSAVMNDDIFPAVTGYPGLVNRSAHGRREISPVAPALWGGDLFGLFLSTGFLDYDLVLLVVSPKNPPATFLLDRRRWGRRYRSFFSRFRRRWRRRFGRRRRWCY